MDTEKIGLFLAQLREEKKLKQIDVASILNVSYKNISKWEKGISIPDISVISDLAKVYEVDIEEIINGQRDIKKRNKLKRNKRINKTIKILLIVLIPIFIYFFIFFCIENDSYNVYKVTSMKDNNKINGYVIEKNDIYFFNVVFDKINNEYINNEDQFIIEVYYNNKLLNIFNKNNISFSIYNDVKLKNIYYKVVYQNDNYKETSNIIKCKYKHYNDSIKYMTKNVNDIMNDELSLSKEKLLKYGFIQKGSIYEYVDNDKIIQIDDKLNTILYREKNDLISNSIKYYYLLNNMEVVVYQKNNNTKILLEKYTYNTKSKETDCLTQICTSAEDMFEIVTYYLTLFKSE